MSLTRHLPIALIVTRAALGPVLVALAVLDADPIAFAICLIVGLLSDYFDGVIARKLGIATPNLRRMDSIADSVFYIGALAAAWYLHADLLQPYVPSVLCLLALEMLRYAFDYRKFGKEASYHMWSSKLWGLALFFAFVAVLVKGEAGWPVALAIYLGIAADLEGLAISAILTTWKTDVPTVFHALRMSRA